MLGLLPRQEFDPKRSHDGKVAAFVRKETHGLARGLFARRSTHTHRFFERHGVDNVANGSLDVGLSNTAVGSSIIVRVQ